MNKNDPNVHQNLFPDARSVDSDNIYQIVKNRFTKNKYFHYYERLSEEPYEYRYLGSFVGGELLLFISEFLNKSKTVDVITVMHDGIVVDVASDCFKSNTIKLNS